MSSILDGLQRQFLRAFTEALFDGQPMAITSKQVVRNIETQLDLIGGKAAQRTKMAIMATFILLGPFDFLQMTNAQRRQRMESRLINTTTDEFQDLARIRGIVLAGYYGHWVGDTRHTQEDNPVWQTTGFIHPEKRPRALPDRKPIRNTTHDLRPDAFVTVDAINFPIDVIVVGSGAGGGVAAYNLAAKGHKVLVIERGGHNPSSVISAEERVMAARLFRDGALQFSSDNDVVLFQGNTVGGSTTVNNGICLRLYGDDVHPDGPDILQNWADMGAAIDRNRMTQSYEAVEAQIGFIRPDGRVSAIEGHKNGNHFIDGWNGYKAAHPGNTKVAHANAKWFFKSWGQAGSGHECVYCGYCNTGCAYGRRMGSIEAFLRPATQRVDTPVRILTDAEVEQIEWKGIAADGKKVASGVRVKLSNGDDYVIRARKGVVIAAGTMASSRIMRDSGYSNSGDDLSVNMACPVVALMPDGATSPAWDEDQMTSYVDCGDYLLESHFQPIMSMAALVTGWFDEHFRRMHVLDRVTSAGVLVPIDRKGKISGRSASIKLSYGDLARMRTALATLCKVHFKAGAIEIWPALSRGQKISAGATDADIDAFFEEHVRDSDDLVLSSSHPHGGNGFHPDYRKGVVDMTMKVHGTRNVLICDASVFPSCIKVNAQLSTMAISHYATGFEDPFA